MNTSARRLLCAILILGGSTLPAAAEPSSPGGFEGGLVVYVGGADLERVVTLGGTGRYLLHVVETDLSKAERAREVFRAAGIYGLATAEALPAGAGLPYTENLVNAVVLQSRGGVEWGEVLRVLAPGGAVVVAVHSERDVGELRAAGFESVTLQAEGALVARKPWPGNMDGWSHPRHGANGNAVSRDTAVGPPERVRWVAAALDEVEGLVTAGGRNFYGGVLARDSFNGLRLWHRDLAKAELNGPEFNLPRLSYDRARPVAGVGHLFAVLEGRLVGLDAATGEVVREYAGVGKPDEVIMHRGVVIAADDQRVVAFEVGSGRELWQHAARDPRCLAAENETACFLHGQPTRGEPVEVLAVDLVTGRPRWRSTELPWLNKVFRVVLHGDLAAFEVSSLSDHDAGNRLHVLSAETGELVWEKAFPPGMNHMRQARAMFTGSDLWILHGGKENTATKEGTTRSLVQVSALNPKTGEVLKTHPAGLAHCFPPVATPKYVFAGVLDLTDMATGDILANPITKANCSRENGWVPANGLIYTTPKHCTCWPMLRGFVALAPAPAERDSPVYQPVESIRFPLVHGPASPPDGVAEPGPEDWPTYRGDAWRSGSSGSDGPGHWETRWQVSLVDAGAPVAGPIRCDWRENPFVKGPVSAPVIANGRVFVARSDTHEVLALDADTGREEWRFTARGRVDTPPTIQRGLVLFGCHAGYVYALRADDGRRVWELRAAPTEERIVAFGQLESPWPVPGTVLVRGDTAYFVAGRQSLADGGVLIFAVDPLSGKQRWVHRLDDIPHKGDPTGQNPFQGFYENSGLEFDPVDLLHAEGDGIAMSRWILSRDGQSVSVDKWNAFARLNTGGGEVWVPRGSWTYGARHQDRFRGEAPIRPLVVFRDGAVYGQMEASTELFRRDFDAQSITNFSAKWITGWEAGRQAGKGEKPFRSHRVAEGARWRVDVFTPAEARAKPFKPGTQLHNDIHALALAGNGRLYAVHKDGRLKVIDTRDGSVLAEGTVPHPMWDGLAIAGGRVFLSTLSGAVWCGASAGK